MLETVLIVLAILALAIVALLAYAASRPDSFTLKRSTVINAEPGRVFPLISNLRQMNTWNPFAQGDPTLRLAYSGPESGTGSAFDWDSDGQCGKGRIEITDANPPSRLAMTLTMMKPMKAQNLVEFTLRPAGSATEVTWSMTGERPLIAKIMHVLFNMDRMVGGHFEKGLADLKAKAEG